MAVVIRDVLSDVLHTKFLCVANIDAVIASRGISPLAPGRICGPDVKHFPIKCAHCRLQITHDGLFKEALNSRDVQSDCIFAAPLSISCLERVRDGNSIAYVLRS